MSDVNNLVTIAQKQVGVRETTQNRGTQVEIFLNAVGLDYSGGYTYPGYSWCAAFVKWCMGQAGIKTPGMNAMAASCQNENLVYSGGVWHKALQAGDVFTIYSTVAGRIVHCGICVELQGDDLHTVEGNTNDNGSSNGDGVYEKDKDSLHPRNMDQIHSISRWI